MYFLPYSSSVHINFLNFSTNSIILIELIVTVIDEFVLWLDDYSLGVLLFYQIILDEYS